MFLEQLNGPLKTPQTCPQEIAWLNSLHHGTLITHGQISI